MITPMPMQNSDSGQPSRSWRPIWKWAGVTSLVLLFLLVTVQFIVWRNYSFEATYLQGKKLFGLATEKDLLDLGAICNTLERYPCSARNFSAVLETSPSHRQALANLAIALAKGGRWAEAKSTFISYFSLNAGSYDTLFWYAQAVEHVDGIEKSLEWYYLAQSYHLTFTEGILTLTKKLSEIGRDVEALSLIGAYLSTEGAQQRVVRPIQEKLERELSHKWEEGKGLADPIELPQVDGKNFFAPVRFLDDGPIRFFVLDDSIPYVILNYDVLDENQILIPDSAKPQKVAFYGNNYQVRAFKVRDLILGLYSFSSVEVLVCAGCPQVLGRPITRQLNMRIWSRNQIDFMQVSKEESARTVIRKVEE